MLRGAARYVTRWQLSADRKPYCDDPKRINRATGRGVKPLEVSMWGPCRKCAKCLRFKQIRWRDRAINEIVMAHERGGRTWFVTLTISPVHMAGLIAEAKAKYGEFTPRSLDRATWPHVQKYLDRLRKRLKTRFRYFGALERGEEKGRTHYHLLIHEVGPRPLLYRPLCEEWRSFVDARVVHVDDPLAARRAARYVSKYATKTAEVSRIRASLRYGDTEARTK